jgi:hypothetical protein
MPRQRDGITWMEEEEKKKITGRKKKKRDGETFMEYERKKPMRGPGGFNVEPPAAYQGGV